MLFFLLPLFSTIILDAGGDKGEVGLRFFGILCVENVLLGFGNLRIYTDRTDAPFGRQKYNISP